MRDAEELADRICILNGGKIEACGKLHELKRKYGAGFSLLVEPIDKSVEEMEKLADLIQTFMDSVEDEQSAEVDHERREFFTTQH